MYPSFTYTFDIVLYFIKVNILFFSFFSGEVSNKPPTNPTKSHLYHVAGGFSLMLWAASLSAL